MNTHSEQTPPVLVLPGTAAELLGVTTRTLINYQLAGRLHPVRTLGGQRRYSLAEVQQLRAGNQVDQLAGAVAGAA